METKSQGKSTVLYVDDIKANLMLFEASFDSEYNVLLAESGKEALKVLEENEIQVLVSDQNMPGMTGNELLEIVTSNYPDIMRFMITAYTDYETVVEAINKGHLYGFFNKPYNIEDVKISIDKSLEVRNLRISNREMFKKLEKANNALLGLDRTKTKFLSSVTDEIRTPINKIMTAVHMIKDKIDSNEIAELLQMLDQSVGRLESFSDTAQQLVRLNDSETSLDHSEVSLKEIAEVALIEKGNMLSEAEIGVKLDVLTEELKVIGEFDLLLACLSSLLRCFWTNSEKGSELKLEISKNDSHAVISIESNAVTYTSSEKKELSIQIGGDISAVDRDGKLELILALEIMAAHNGYIKFLDKNENVAAFEMVFPLMEN